MIAVLRGVFDGLAAGMEWLARGATPLTWFLAGALWGALITWAAVSR